MASITGCAAFVLVGVWFVTSGVASAAEIVRPQLLVRTYFGTPVRPADWQAAVLEATSILEVAGIDLQWVDCSTATAVMNANCAIPERRNEVVIRVVRGRTPMRREQPLGESLVVPKTGAGTLATMYLDRIEWLARAGCVSTGILLGRAMAHELGHLVLGTTAHSTRGLMRPIWTRDDLARDRATDWRIPADEGRRMRAAFAVRLNAIASESAHPEPGTPNDAPRTPNRT
jgi:hypothetical protein